MHCRFQHHGRGFILLKPKLNVSNVQAFLRLNGPMTDTVLFKKTHSRVNHDDQTKNTSIWVAKYSLCKAGDYTGAVHVYLQDSDTSPHADEQFLQGSSCINSNGLDSPAIFRWTQNAVSRACSGVWFWKGSLSSPDLHELAVYRSPVRPDYTTAYSALECSLSQGALPANWTSKTVICMYGDSQIRNLHNSLCGMLFPDTCLPDFVQRFKGLCQAPPHALSIRYGSLNYPNEWVYSNEITSLGCTHVFVNVGHHPAAHCTVPPWGMQNYRLAIEPLLAALVALKQSMPHIQIAWVDTNPCTFIPHWQRQCPAQDWRVPHILHGYNQVARQQVALTNGSISYFETFRAAFALFDLSFDLSHYQGPVGNALARLLLQRVLN
jgi:hypothetical protein